MHVTLKPLLATLALALTCGAFAQEATIRKTLAERLPNVKIDEGRHKYVQIRASVDGEEQVFVTSKRGAHYHRDAAEPFISALEEAGYHDIDVAGGGRIDLDTQAKRISIYGYSYGFGLADHELSKSVVLKDPRYKDFDITTSNAGY